MACGDNLDFSLNEVEGCALKAARGAGFAWGEAEEISQAARWHACLGLDWSGELLAILHMPQPESDALCGILGGIAMADRLSQLEAGQGPHVSAPLSYAHWALPTLARAAAGAQLALKGTIGDHAFFISEKGTVSFAEPLVSHGAKPLVLTLSYAKGQEKPEDFEAGLSYRRSTVTLACRDALEGFVLKTYVPTSEKSRLRGVRPAPLLPQG